MEVGAFKVTGLPYAYLQMKIQHAYELYGLTEGELGTVEEATK